MPLFRRKRRELTPEEIAQSQRELEAFGESLIEGLAQSNQEHLDVTRRDQERRLANASPRERAYLEKIYKDSLEAQRDASKRITDAAARNIRAILKDEES